MEGLINATFALLTDPVGLLIFACAMVAGLVSGIIPGFGITSLAAAILPFTAALSLPYAMVLYGALFISGVTGRWVVGIDAGEQTALVGLRGPGTLQPGTLQIMLGGVIAAMFAVLLTEGVAGYVFFGFKAPEMFGLAFLALAAVAGVAWRHGAKGWLALFLGLLLGMSVVGPVSAAPRYIFGSLDILASITFVPLLIGFMVVPGMLDAVTRKVVLIDKSSASRITLSATATNAALLPLVALGLPLSMGAVVLMAAAGLQGLELGPLFIIEAEEAVWALLAAAVWASVLAAPLGLLMARPLMMLRRISQSVAGAGLFVVAVAGVYALDAHTNDVYIMFVCGLAGYLLGRQGYPLAIIILGVVLTQIAEPAFANAVSLLDGGALELLQRPVSAVLIVSGLLVMATVAMWRVEPSACPVAEETENHEGS